MLPYWMPMPSIISDSEVKELERLVLDGHHNFIPYPTKNGNYDGNLCWDNNIEKYNRFPLKSYTMFVHQPIGKQVIPHVDNDRWDRNTVLLVPLFWHEEYAPCEYTDGPKITHESPVLMNTQKEHFVNNSEHVRYNFQICFAEPIEEVYECLTHI
tara:strand:- start:325 stop:789 length:465 start_codon:yes stop_codon:yes gene_type:complete